MYRVHVGWSPKASRTTTAQSRPWPAYERVLIPKAIDPDTGAGELVAVVARENGEEKILIVTFRCAAVSSLWAVFALDEEGDRNESCCHRRNRARRITAHL